MPSMRNRFSLPPEPNADTVLTVPLDGDVGETPGAALIKSNMLNRRVGIGFEVLGSEARFEPAASRFDARARSLDDDRFRDACQLQDHRSLERGTRADADVLFVIGRKSLQLDVEHRTVREAEPGTAVALSRSWSWSTGPPISAGEVTRTDAPGRTPPCSSLTVPTRAPVKLCATTTARPQKACCAEEQERPSESAR